MAGGTRPSARRHAPARPRSAPPTGAVSSSLKHELQAVRQHLQEIQDKHRVLLEITDTGYVIVDNQGRVLDANAEYVRLSGHHELDELLGRNVAEWTAEHDRGRNGEKVRKCAEEGSVRGLVVDYQWHDGTIVPIEINASTLATDAGQVIVSVCRDISRRRRDEQLMIAQRDLALGLGTTHDLAAGLRLCLLTSIRVSKMDCGGIYMADPASGGLLMLVHEGFSPTFVAAVHRCDKNSPKTRLVMRGIPEYHAFDQLGRTFDAAQIVEGLRSVAVIPVQIQGKVIGCMHIASHTMHEVPQFSRVALEAIAAQMSNAVERLRLLDDLRDERGLFVAGPVVVFKWRNNPKQGFPVEYVSPNVATQFGYQPNDFLSGRVGYMGLIHPDDMEARNKTALKHKDHPRSWYEEEYRLKHADGLYRWVRDCTMTLRSADGVLTHFLGYIQDVSQHKRADEDRRNIESQMLHAQKLESLGVLAGGIAHDFNNILMAILGNIDLALMDIPPESPTYKNLHEAERASRRAADLCRQMLAYAGRGSYQPRPHDVSGVVDDMRRMLEVSVSKKTQLRFELSRQLPAIETDLSQLHQVVMNLVINASEAMVDRNGTVVVSTGLMECDRACLHDALLGESLAAGPYVYIEVADMGCGMDAETRARIFDPFFTTKSSGRGLGLAAVLGIVRAHHGAIKLTSEPDRGSTFRIMLPASVEAAKPLPDAADHNREWRGSGTLLLVDDEETIRTVGRKMLELLGFTVLTASSGPTAIEMFRAHADDILGVILDLTMPQMGGDEVFPVLRGIKPDIPVLLASGYSEQELARRLNKLGFVGFIQKPYTINMLASKLRAMLDTGTRTHTD